MTKSDLEDAFGHHVWATLSLMDVCAALTPEQLASPVPGTYGSILDTLRHTVGADASYLRTINSGRTPDIDEDAMELPELRAVMETHGAGWSSVLKEGFDPEAVVVRVRDDGSESHAPLGIRIGQVLHHGTDHRSQICTGLTALGIEPPEIDVWDYGMHEGTVKDVPSPA
jgi:uncharacterized damage-inducible protein DinB